MYAELQAGIVAFLDTEEDIFGLPVIPDAPPNTEETANTHLLQEGVCLVIGKPRQTSRGATEVNVQVPMMVLENDVVNRSGENGLDREPEQILVDLISCLDGAQTEAFWTPFNVRPFDSRDQEYGQVAWGIMLETKTLIVRDYAILVDHNGSGICDHNHKVILTTNRGR